MTRTRNALIPAIAGFALVLGSCGRDAPTATPTESLLSRQGRSHTEPAPKVVYGPAMFTRDTGKPRTDCASFSARAGDTLTFVLSPGAGHGLNATVEVNDHRLFSANAERDGEPESADTIRVDAREKNSVCVWMGGKPGSSLRIIATVPGEPVPVETRLLSVMYEGSVVGSRPSGDTAIALGAHVHYSFAPHAGFRRLRVVVDGTLARDSGTLTMDRAHWIAASADTVIALDPVEQPLAQRLRTLLASSAPREAWRAYQAAVDQAAAGWGAEADVHLARIEAVTIDPVTDLANLVRLDSALAGMETPVELSPGVSPLREGGAMAAERLSATSQRSSAVAAPGTREATQILLVNGILTSENGLRLHARLLDSLLKADPVRFPRPETHLANVYSSSFFASDLALQLAGACFRGFRAQAGARGLSRAGMLNSFPWFVACVNSVRAENDLSVTLRWARDAMVGTPPQTMEVSNLALNIERYRSDSLRHVLVIGHSRGSLLTQLAVQRVKDAYGFDEEYAPRCIGTVSVAGVGGTNWPLSARHSRFVVAKHDLVTTLTGSLFNPHQVSEDGDTRALEPWFGALAGDSVSTHWWTGVPLVASIYIHYLDRYLRSPEMWSAISSGLDQVYRTCAVGAVTVAPSAATLQLYGVASFNATWKALDGQPLTTSDSVGWSVGSALANVSVNGRLVAGSDTGTAAVQARVRQAVGTAVIKIVDDSVRALNQPPSVTVTERSFVSGPNHPGPTTCNMQAITISASPMSGASIVSAELYTRTTLSPDTVYVEHLSVPLDTEINWRWTTCTIGGAVAPWTYRDNWYRVVVTDSNGLFTEKIGPNP